jgi:hypothetical protein
MNTISDGREVIISLLDTIPVIFGSNRLTEPALGPALTAGFEALVFKLIV